MATIGPLDPDSMGVVLSHVNPVDLPIVGQVCKGWRAITTEDTFCSAMLQNRFPSIQTGRENPQQLLMQQCIKPKGRFLCEEGVDYSEVLSISPRGQYGETFFTPSHPLRKTALVLGCKDAIRKGERSGDFIFIKDDNGVYHQFNFNTSQLMCPLNNEKTPIMLKIHPETGDVCWYSSEERKLVRWDPNTKKQHCILTLPREETIASAEWFPEPMDHMLVLITEGSYATGMRNCICVDTRSGKTHTVEMPNQPIDEVKTIATVKGCSLVYGNCALTYRYVTPLQQRMTFDPRDTFNGDRMVRLANLSSSRLKTHCVPISIGINHPKLSKMVVLQEGFELKGVFELKPSPYFESKELLLVGKNECALLNLSNARIIQKCALRDQIRNLIEVGAIWNKELDQMNLAFRGQGLDTTVFCTTALTRIAAKRCILSRAEDLLGADGEPLAASGIAQRLETERRVYLTRHRTSELLMVTQSAFTAQTILTTANDYVQVFEFNKPSSMIAILLSPMKKGRSSKCVFYDVEKGLVVKTDSLSYDRTNDQIFLDQQGAEYLVICRKPDGKELQVSSLRG